MVKLKILMVLTVALVSPILNIKRPAILQTINHRQVVFYNKLDTVILNENDYKIKINSIGFDLLFLNKTKLNHIYRLDDPNVRLSLGDEQVLAKGIGMLSSSVPDGATHFFNFGDNTRILKLPNNTLLFRKTP